MEYTVKLTDHATSQMQETIHYISKVLHAPNVASKWVERIKKELASLSFMPGRYPLTEEEPWHSKGIHKMPVKNFLVYFLIEETRKVVWITDIVYGRRDQLNELKTMPEH